MRRRRDPRTHHLRHASRHAGRAGHHGSWNVLGADYPGPHGPPFSTGTFFPLAVKRSANARQRVVSEPSGRVEWSTNPLRSRLPPLLERLAEDCRALPRGLERDEVKGKPGGGVDGPPQRLPRRELQAHVLLRALASRHNTRAELPHTHQHGRVPPQGSSQFERSTMARFRRATPGGGALRTPYGAVRYSRGGSVVSFSSSDRGLKAASAAFRMHLATRALTIGGTRFRRRPRIGGSCRDLLEILDVRSWPRTASFRRSGGESVATERVRSDRDPRSRPTELLGRHVGERSESPPRPALLAPAPAVITDSRVEVDELRDAVLLIRDVVGLHVAVDDVLCRAYS